MALPHGPRPETEPDDDAQRLKSWPVLAAVPGGPRRAVALTSDRARREIESLLETAPGLDITFVSRIEQLSARVESSCPAILIIDTDLLGMPGDLCRMARSLRPDVFTIALVNHWSLREERLRAGVDAVLHKPPRREEWTRLFGA